MVVINNTPLIRTVISEDWVVGDTIMTLRSLDDSWLLCDGQRVDADRYPDLYKLMSFIPDIPGEVPTYIKAKII